MKKSKFVYWSFLCPCLLAFSIVVILPVMGGIYYSFTEWNGIKGQAKFIGISNYIKIFTTDTAFLNSFVYTFLFTIVAVILVNVIAFFLALLVTQSFKGTNILRSIFFMPNLVGGILVGFAWQFIFTQVFNNLGKVLHISFLCNWLSTPATGTVGMMIVVIWQMSGYMMLIYIAQIKNIPDSYLEAADIDGASNLQKLIKIKLPLMMPAFTIGLFLTLANCFKLYDQNLTLTNGGPYNSTQMLALNICNTAFIENKLGLAQAKGIVFFAAVAIITLTQLIISKKQEVEM